MITGVTFWAEKGRVTAHLHLAYDMFSGAFERNGSHLCVYFDGPANGGFVDADRFAEPWVCETPPAFDAHDVCSADTWLRHYADVVNRVLGDGPAPKPKEEL